MKGKSESICKLYNLLLSQPGASQTTTLLPSNLQTIQPNEICTVLNYPYGHQTYTIGFESESHKSENKRQKTFNGSSSIDYFAQNNCDIIICTSLSMNTNGIPYITSKNYNYDLFFISQFNYYLDTNGQFPTASTRYNAINTKTAESVLSFIKGLLAGTI